MCPEVHITLWRPRFFQSLGFSERCTKLRGPNRGEDKTNSTRFDSTQTYQTKKNYLNIIKLAINKKRSDMNYDSRSFKIPENQPVLT